MKMEVWQTATEHLRCVRTDESLCLLSSTCTQVDDQVPSKRYPELCDPTVERCHH